MRASRLALPASVVLALACAVLNAAPPVSKSPWRRYLTGADYETIQMQMGVSNGSLRGLLHRGLKLLQERLQAELREPH